MEQLRFVKVEGNTFKVNEQRLKPYYEQEELDKERPKVPVDEEIH